MAVLFTDDTPSEPPVHSQSQPTYLPNAGTPIAEPPQLKGHEVSGGYKSHEGEYSDVVRLFDENVVATALYTGVEREEGEDVKASLERNKRYPPMLKWAFKDRNTGQDVMLDIGSASNRNSLLLNVIDDLKSAHPWLSKRLSRDYEFKGEKNIVSRHIRKDEGAILVSALEQALTLIYNHPILRNMMAIAPIYHRNPKPELLENFKAKIIGDGLPIFVHEHEEGFRGSKANHGSLFAHDDEGGIVALHLDEEGNRSILELIHEYSAFLVLKESGVAKENKSGHLTLKSIFKFWKSGDEILEQEKHKNLAYILLFIDAIAQGAGDAEDYLQIDFKNKLS